MCTGAKSEAQARVRGACSQELDLAVIGIRGSLQLGRLTDGWNKSVQVKGFFKWHDIILQIEDIIVNI